MLMRYGFITLLQRIFNYDKMQHISITADKVLNSLAIWITFLRHHIYELQTVKNGGQYGGLHGLN